MKEKKIRMVIDKKNLLLADQNLDITKDIFGLLNKKLKSINIDFYHFNVNLRQILNVRSKAIYSLKH